MSKKLSFKQKLRLERLQRKALLKKQKSAARRKSGANKFFTTQSGLVISHQNIMTSQQYPLFECQISDNWQETGLAYIWISRKTPLYIIVAAYLVDIRCLGLKDVLISAFRSESEYKQFKNTSIQSYQKSFLTIDCDFALANKIIYGAIDYARQFGFEPHKDFQLAQYILGPKIISTKKIQFGGEDDKPVFIPGPYDNVKEIVQKLIDSVGEDGFNYVAIN
ncbi:MAG: hypothetical protein M1142_03830 [Patescibacteria group bacterium]|nr:hypothetical protein [Patescibacteria group bacterium]